MTATQTIDLAEMTKDEEVEGDGIQKEPEIPPPPDACKKHQKDTIWNKQIKRKAGFWSSCPECHKARMKYHRKLRAKGLDPGADLIENAATKAIHETKQA